MTETPKSYSKQQYKNKDGEIFEIGICECEHTILRRISPLRVGCNTKNIPYEKIDWDELEKV